MFVCLCLVKFAGESLFSFYALGMKALGMVLLRRGCRKIGKSNMPEAWFELSPWTHIARDASTDQGALYSNMLRVADEMRRNQWLRAIIMMPMVSSRRGRNGLGQAMSEGEAQPKSPFTILQAPDHRVRMKAL